MHNHLSVPCLPFCHSSIQHESLMYLLCQSGGGWRWRVIWTTMPLNPVFRHLVYKPGLMAHTWNPNIQELHVGGSLELGSWRSVRRASTQRFPLRGLEDHHHHHGASSNILQTLQPPHPQENTARETKRIPRPPRAAHSSPQSQCSCYALFMPKRFKIHKLTYQSPRWDFCQCNHFRK